MPQIPEHIVKRIRDDADIVAILESEFGVEFRTKRGKFYKAKCPFHDETRPSFGVYIYQQRFTCFSGGCDINGKSGDIFNLFMWHPRYRMTFPEAVKHVAKLYNHFHLVADF